MSDRRTDDQSQPAEGWDLDDEREVPLDDSEPPVPSTIDPDERVELADDDIETISGDGPHDI